MSEPYRSKSRIGEVGSADPGTPLRLLSYNIQAGLETGHYGHYLTRSWRHALPGRDMRATLDRLAAVIRDYDFVALQEADAGSLRTGFRNQIAYLAQRGGFHYHDLAVTRRLRPIAQHSLGFLSRFAPASVERYVLPAPIPGRHAMRIVLGAELNNLTLLITHLSLAAATRNPQLTFLCKLVAPGTPTVLMGDLNADLTELRAHLQLGHACFSIPATAPPTFPSWRPQRSLDHILASPEIEVRRLYALPNAISDHLAIAADITVFAKQ